MRSWLVFVAFVSLVGCRERAPSIHAPEDQPTPRPSSNAEKLDVARQLLAKGPLLVNFDPRKPGVVVPDRFRAEKRLVLQYGHDLTPAIPDLELREDGISATLSFSKKPFKTFVPWSAVFAIVDDESHGKLWQEDVPPDLELESNGSKL